MKLQMWINKLVPADHAKQLELLPEQPEELRFCAGQPILVRMAEKELQVWPKLDATDVLKIFQSACRQSVYAHTNTICRGYLALEGGHRMGICGFGVSKDKEIQTLISPSSLVLRVAREHLGCANLIGKQCSGSTLILGPPGCGKTTLLRDFVRYLSDEKCLRIGLADERGEVSAMADGMPQMQIGRRTDVLVNVPKAEAVMMLLRTMNPQWIAMDEITAPDDLQALRYASYCGVKLVATAHGECADDLLRRPLYRQLMDAKIFSHLVVLTGDHSVEIKELTA